MSGRAWWCRRGVRLLFALPLLVLLLAGGMGFAAVAVLGREIPDIRPASPTEDPSRPLLVAVGDSFMSGEGAPSYLLGTNSDTNRCHRARTAHPFLLAASEDYRLVSVACSGAVTANLTGEQEQYDNGRQLDAMSRSDLHSAAEQVDILLVGVGGNDASFGDIVRNCLNERNCAPRHRGWLEQLHEVERRLGETYRQIAAARAPDTRVLVMTYPQPFAEDATCIVGLKPNERDFVLQSFLPHLNHVIRYQAIRYGFEVVEAGDAFAGARLCETAFADAAMNVFTLANSGRGSVSGGSVTGSFHPTPLGHQMLAARVREQLRQPPPAAPPPGLPPPPPTAPPRPDTLPPGSEVPFPSGTPCSGASIQDETVRSLNDGQLRVEVAAAVGTRLCYRDSYAPWQSVQVGPDGRVRLDVRGASQARVRYVEVLSQRPDGTWLRTLLFPPPNATPAELRFYDGWLGWLIALTAVTVLTALTPWLACAISSWWSRSPQAAR